MDNLNPLPEPHEELPPPEVVQRSPVDVQPDKLPPVEYTDTDDRDFSLAALLATVWGKAVIGGLAAAILGGTVWHFAHHKHALQPIVPVSHSVAQAPAKHTEAVHKHMVSHKHPHKTKKPVRKSTAHKSVTDQKGHTQPWLSGREQTS